uniref:Evasin n=1 Tax=Rhipicephalus zambeziensis TaxID=60191 RepID=A0A224Z1B8_9ACAR
MKALLPFALLNVTLQYLLLFGYDDRTNVGASNCEYKGKLVVNHLVELQNASVRAARLRYGMGPIHFAEVCPGFCEEHKVGVWCSPNCLCRVLDAIDPPIFMCFEEGKPLPMGFK